MKDVPADMHEPQPAAAIEALGQPTVWDAYPEASERYAGYRESMPPAPRGHTVLIICLTVALVAAVALAGYLVLSRPTGVDAGAADVAGGTTVTEAAETTGAGTIAAGAPAPDDPALTYEALVQTVGERTPVSVRFVSCDASAYPTVRLYLAVEDGAGNVVGLDNPSVALLEGISGGEQLRREVTRIAQLEGSEGVSYSIVVDKSDSMSGDIAHVRSILSDFVSHLDYGAGDEAELIAFDSFVMYMCTYTDNVGQLMNGVANMETYGMTALYDALYAGIQDAYGRGGARCVIAFTDGEDNESTHTADEVANLAATYAVPVFIVGTRGANASVLMDICSRTGGRYFNIDDVQDLGDVLGDITHVERGMYCIEYVSDAGSAAEATRQVSVAFADATFGGLMGSTVTPTVALARQPHSTRYEVVRDNVTWTEANAACLARGGHLATIGSESEMAEVTSLVDAAGLEFAWIGGYTSMRGSSVFGHWITGEDFGYQAWYPGEPSRNDRDGTPEMYMILWKVGGVWSWNDERNDPQYSSEMDYMLGSMGYVCEYES